MMSTCQEVHDELAELVAGDRDAIARHADHLAGCDECRDVRHEATELVGRLAQAGDDHVVPADLVARVLAKVGDDPAPDTATADTMIAPAPAAASATAAASPTASTSTPATPTTATASSEAPRGASVTPIRSRGRTWLAIGAAAAVAAGTIGFVALRGGGDDAGTPGALATRAGAVGTIDQIARAAADGGSGISLKAGDGWRVLGKGEVIPAGATLKTDERTRARLVLADGTTLVLDHGTGLTFDRAEPRRITMAAGRLVAEVATVEGRPASITTPAGTIDVIGTKFTVTATDTLTSVQVVRGTVALSTGGKREQIHAGEEGMIEGGALTIGAAPSLAAELGWAELAQTAAADDDVAMAGVGALRAYKPGEKRDRDWKLALAKHDVKVRIVGPIARTEITETFRNDSAETLEGVYQFPLPADAQIDGLSLDMPDQPGGFIDGAFLAKDRAQKIWQGVIDKATPKIAARPSQEIIWVPGRWRDPALLDWKRGGRFELRVYPIPAKGQRTIKLAYTQVVTARGPFRQYVYPLAHSADGSTVADNFTVDVEVRGAMPGLVRTTGYQLTHDAARKDVTALTLASSGFVPRGDLVVDYRATDGDAELRAWTFAGGAAVGPDEKIAAKRGVGIDPKVIAAQRAVASDARPTAVLALRPALQRWRQTKPRDYAIVIDASQSMVGERYKRASDLAAAIVEQLDRRDRFTIAACDSECRGLGDLQAPSTNAARTVEQWLAAQPVAGASDVVASIRAAAELTASRDADRERWVLFLGDGFATTGFRRVADVERALAEVSDRGVHVTTIGLGGDADAAVLAAVARGGGGSYLAWLPGQPVKLAALSAIESTHGASLRGATVELPAGLADVAPTVLPTLRAGEEVLIAARVTGAVRGDVVVRGEVGGQPFEQRYPLELQVSSAPGNGFVPRLWAALAIEQMERRGEGDDRLKVIALSQAYGLMSKETSLLVLESQAMFDAFGVDRSSPTAKWTGEEELDEVVASGAIAMNKDDGLGYGSSGLASGGGKAMDAPAMSAPSPKKPSSMSEKPEKAKKRPMADPFEGDFSDVGSRGGGRGMIAMRRTWVRVPSVSAYDGVNDAIRKAIADSEAALASSPDSREKHRALVQALAYAGELDRAREVANQWRERDELDPQALGYIADLLGRDGQRDLALRTLAGLVDLAADRPALHERMVSAYEAAGRLSQACSHRITLAALSPKDAATAGQAMRCLRTVGRDRDATLVARALPDDATRAAAEKAATVAAVDRRAAGDLVVTAHWDGSADLDVTVVTPQGSRVSWMGGRTDVTVEHATSSQEERLAIKRLRRGNYLVEVARAAASQGPIRGTIEISVLGTKKSLPFELLGSHVVVGRVAVRLDERLEQVSGFDMRPRDPRVAVAGISDPVVARGVRSRMANFRACYQRELSRNPGISGRMMVTLVIDDGGRVALAQIPSSALPGSVVSCVQSQLTRLRFPSGAATEARFAMMFQ